MGCDPTNNCTATQTSFSKRKSVCGKIVWPYVGNGAPISSNIDIAVSIMNHHVMITNIAYVLHIVHCLLVKFDILPVPWTRS